MVSFAAGALSGVAFIHLLPEAFEDIPALSVSALSCWHLALFALENFRAGNTATYQQASSICVAVVNLVGVHNLIDDNGSKLPRFH